jgi:hypothetical protein
MYYGGGQFSGQIVQADQVRIGTIPLKHAARGRQVQLSPVQFGHDGYVALIVQCVISVRRVLSYK